MSFFKSLFTGKGDHEADADAKAAHKKFEILKYDGMRAQRMGRTDYAIQCFSQALALQSDFETMSYLARAYVQSGKLEEARAQLDGAPRTYAYRELPHPGAHLLYAGGL